MADEATPFMLNIYAASGAGGGAGGLSQDQGGTGSSEAAGHSITSSASNCIALETTTPSALAVFRLMTSSNLVD